jgi:hypothetical protein
MLQNHEIMEASWILFFIFDHNIDLDKILIS